MKSVVDILGSQLGSSAPRILGAVFYCLARALQRLDSQETAQEKANNETNVGLLSHVRKEGYACMSSIFSACPDVVWDDWRVPLVEELVNPRLANFAAETSQGLSSLLKLFAAWSLSDRTAIFLVEPNNSILDHVAECLTFPSVKDEVKIFILKNIVQPILEIVENVNSSSSVVAVFQQHFTSQLGEILVCRVGELLDTTQNRECIDVAAPVLIHLQQYLRSATQTWKLLQSCARLLKKPAREVSPKLKSQILRLIDTLLHKEGLEMDRTAFEELYAQTTGLFSYFFDSTNRSLLVQVLNSMSAKDDSLAQAAHICGCLNAYTNAKLDEVDWEQRQSGYAMISELQKGSLRSREWRPILHNLIYFTKDEGDLSTRAGASASVNHFIQIKVSSPSEGDDEETLALVDKTLLPAISKGLLEKSEFVRRDHLDLLAQLVRAEWKSVSDLKSLLPSGDEVSFFDAFDIQRHRRLRGIRQLGSRCNTISSVNLGQFCLPLIELFIEEATTKDENSQNSADESARNIAEEALGALENITPALEWRLFKALADRTLTKAKKMDSKLRVRALRAVVNGLSGAYSEESILATTTCDAGLTSDRSNLAKSMPDSSTCNKYLEKNLLAPLMEIAHFKDETAIEFRVLVAGIAMKAIMLLPQDQTQLKLSALLMDISNILKSRAQDARNTARKTLAEMSTYIGPRWFPIVIKSLRTALQRGYQLHVLAYTMHSLLVSVSTVFTAGDLDGCIPDVMDIVIDDALGLTGQEKEARDYISTMTEVRKKSMSYDTLELLATLVGTTHMVQVIIPIQMQLQQPKPKIEKITECLRRVREGLRRNPATQGRVTLKLCHEILNNSLEPKDSKPTNVERSIMATFALDLLRRVLDKDEDLKTNANLSGFIGLIIKALEDGDEGTRTSGLRLLVTIIKVPLPGLDEQAPQFIRLCRRLVEDSPSTNTPLVQAAIRFVSALLRERSNTLLSHGQFDDHVEYLLRRVQPDLHAGQQGDKEKQVAAFSLLKATLARDKRLNEMYKIMDTVREVMISSTEPPIPDLARGVYARFITFYFPEEGKGFQRQLDFLIANLQYPTPSGRQSVMEVLHFVLSRKNDSAVQEIILQVFQWVLIRIVTEDSEDCRAVAQLLLKQNFERANKQTRLSLRGEMIRWLRPGTDQQLQQASFYSWMAFIEVGDLTDEEAKALLGAVADMMINREENGMPLLRVALQTLDRCLERSFVAEDERFTCPKLRTWLWGGGFGDNWSAVAQYVTSGDQEIQKLALDVLWRYVGSWKEERQGGKVLVFSETSSIQVEEVNDIFRACTNLLRSGAKGYLEDRAAAIVTSISLKISKVAEFDSTMSQLLQELAAVVRLEVPGDKSARAKLVALRILSSLCSAQIPTQVWLDSIEDTLLPLHHLTDAAIPAPKSWADSHNAQVQEEIVSTAHKVLEQLQKKLGSSVYLEHMRNVQTHVWKRREERGIKRKTDTIRAPERTEKIKQRKHAAEKTKRRAGNALAAGRRRGW